MNQFCVGGGDGGGGIAGNRPCGELDVTCRALGFAGTLVASTWGPGVFRTFLSNKREISFAASGLYLQMNPFLQMQDNPRCDGKGHGPLSTSVVPCCSNIWDRGILKCTSCLIYR